MNVQSVNSHNKSNHVIENAHLDRRDVVALGMMGLGLTAFAVVVNGLQDHTRELTSSQREHLSEIAKERLEWTKISNSRRNSELFVARRDSGETVVIGYMQGQGSTYYEVRITHSEHDFLYRCSCQRMRREDRQILKALFSCLSGKSM